MCFFVIILLLGVIAASMTSKKSWWIHNIFAHPLMQVVGYFNKPMAKKIHDFTIPEDKKEEKDVKKDDVRRE